MSNTPINTFIDPENEPVAPIVKPTVHLVFVLDRSGSMEGKEEQVVSGFNSYIEKLRADESTNYIVTRTQFDDKFQTDCVVVPLADLPEMTHKDYHPRGMTALRDGIGYGINTVLPLVEPGQGVLMVINTDGKNSPGLTQEFSAQQISDKVADLKTKDWTFVYLDADPTTGKEEAIGVAKMFSMDSGNVHKYQANNTQELYGNLAKSTISYSSMRCATAKAGGQLSATANFCAAMEDQETAPAPVPAATVTLTVATPKPTNK